MSCLDVPLFVSAFCRLVREGQSPAADFSVRPKDHSHKCARKRSMDTLRVVRCRVASGIWIGYRNSLIHCPSSMALNRCGKPYPLSATSTIFLRKECQSRRCKSCTRHRPMPIAPRDFCIFASQKSAGSYEYCSAYPISLSNCAPPW